MTNQSKYLPQNNRLFGFTIFPQILWIKLWITFFYDRNILEDLLNLGFAIPPIQEQIEISKFIAEYLEKNHSLMEKAKQAIQLMQERRTALISSAVTGKIDVRNWQNPTEAKMEFSA